jgi:hypothetical protein
MTKGHTTGKNRLPDAVQTALHETLTEIAHDLGYLSIDELPSNLTATQTATILGVNNNTLAQWRHHGSYSLTYRKMGRTIRYPARAVALFLLERTYQQAHKPCYCLADLQTAKAAIFPSLNNGV